MWNKEILSINRRVAKILCSLLVICALICIDATCGTSWRSWPREEFSPEAWKASAKEKRYVYYHDLAKTKKLDGLLKKDVVDLLGQPDFVSPDGRYITYILKYAEKGERSFNAIYILEIDFDASGSVSRYFVRVD